MRPLLTLQAPQNITGTSAWEAQTGNGLFRASGFGPAVKLRSQRLSEPLPRPPSTISGLTYVLLWILSDGHTIGWKESARKTGIKKKGGSESLTPPQFTITRATWLYKGLCREPLWLFAKHNSHSNSCPYLSLPHCLLETAPAPGIRGLAHLREFSLYHPSTHPGLQEISDAGGTALGVGSCPLWGRHPGGSTGWPLSLFKEGHSELKVRIKLLVLLWGGSRGERGMGAKRRWESFISGLCPIPRVSQQLSPAMPSVCSLEPVGS